MAVLKKVVPSDRTKYYPDEHDYVASFGDSLSRLVAPGGGQDYAKMALIGQRGALANKYATEAAGQGITNQQLQLGLDATQGAMNDPTLSSSMFGGIDALTKFAVTNPGQFKAIVEAFGLSRLQPGQVEKQNLENQGLKNLRRAEGITLRDPQGGYPVDPEFDQALSQGIQDAIDAEDIDQLRMLKEMQLERTQGPPLRDPTPDELRGAYTIQTGKLAGPDDVFTQVEAEKLRERSDRLARFKITEDGKIEKYKSDNVKAGVLDANERTQVADMLKNALDASVEIYGHNMTLQAALDANNKELEGTKYDSELRQETEMLNNALQASVDIYGSQLTLKAALDSNQKILEAAKAESTDKLSGTKYVADKDLEGKKYDADRDMEASMFDTAQDAAANIHKTNIGAETDIYGIDKDFEKNMFGIAQETAVDIYEINKRAETNDWKNSGGGTGSKTNTKKGDKYSPVPGEEKPVDHTKTYEGVRTKADAADTMGEKYPIGVVVNEEGNEVPEYTYLSPKVGKRVRKMLEPIHRGKMNKQRQRAVVQEAKRVLREVKNPHEVEAIMKVMLGVEEGGSGFWNFFN